MKIKLDYVTNSSSVSVVLLGTTIEMNEEIEKNPTFKKKLIELLKENVDEDLKKSYDDMSEEELIDEIMADIDLVFSKAGIDYGSTDYTTYVGLSPFKIKDEETGLEFKLRVVELLESVGIKVPIDKLEKIEESWYDG